MLLQNISKEFKKRQDKLVAAYPDSAFILPSNAEYIRNDDVHYPFRQDSNLFYMTGFSEPGSCAVVLPSDKGSKLVLFVQERNKLMEMWEGERYGVERAKEVFGADECYPIEELESRLGDAFSNVSTVYYRLGLYPQRDLLVTRAMEKFRKSMGRTGRGYLPVKDSKQAIGELRVIKSEEEISQMRQACSITAKAHHTIMEMCDPGMNERELEALFEYEVKMGGCKGIGYGSIVAGGANATCLHYTQNSEELIDGDLLLIDAGGEFENYSADITRTFPIGKTFSKDQEAIYKIVLESQKQAIAKMKPGVTRADIYNTTVDVIVEGLIDLGVLKGKRDKLIEAGAHRQFYPHSWGHFLGMDVHDSGLYVDSEMNHRSFEAGMVMTIEPGIYFQPSESDYPQNYAGIGVRIEDDVLITEGEPEVLTSEVPKEIDDILTLRS